MADNLTNRFVSKADLDAAREARAEEWKKTYERLGQEAPPLPQESEYDPRTLYERLKERKDKEQADFDEKLKFKNQWRGIDSEETVFLEQAEKERRQEQAERRAEIEQEVSEYRKAVNETKKSTASPSTSSALAQSKHQNKTSTKSKKSQKSLLAGVIKKKAPAKSDTKPAANVDKSSDSSVAESSEGISAKRVQSPDDSVEVDRPPKKQKDESSEKD